MTEKQHDHYLNLVLTAAKNQGSLITNWITKRNIKRINYRVLQCYTFHALHQMKA